MKIINLKDLEWEKTSHKASDVLKKVIIKNGDLENITVFGKAVFKSGDKVESHSHPTMYEVFQIIKGKAKFVVGGEEKIVEKEDTIIISPNEIHEQINPFEEDVEWFYFGVATNK